MVESGALYSPRPSVDVHVRPSPSEERPSQRIRRAGQSQITQLEYTGDSHSAPNPPFPPRSLPHNVTYTIPDRDVGELYPPGGTSRQVGPSEATPATDWSHIGPQENPIHTGDDVMGLNLDKLKELCGHIGERAFDDLETLFAPHFPGYADGMGVNAVVCGDTIYGPEVANETPPQVMTQQSANPSWSRANSTTVPSSLDYAQRGSTLEAGPYHFEQTAPTDLESFARNGFTMELPPMAGPSTIKHTSSSPCPQSSHSGCHPSAASSTYLDPPITSSIARSLSTSDISSRAAIPGLVSDLSGSTPSTWDDSTYAQALNAFDPAQIASVNALLNDLRTPPGMTTSDAPGPSEDPLSGGSVPSMPQSVVTTPRPFLCLQPSRTTSKPMPPLPRSIGNEIQTAEATDPSAGSYPVGPMTEWSVGQERTGLDANTIWIDRAASLIALAEEMRSTCKVPEGDEHVRAFRNLHLLFTDMFELCYRNNLGFVLLRRAVSNPSKLRCLSDPHG